MGNRQSGFTLIELVVATAILAVLVVVALAAFNPVAQMRKSRDARRKSDLRQIKTALQLYHNAYGAFPDSSFWFNPMAGEGGSNIQACGDGAAPSDCVWGEQWEREEQVYMKILPEDPLGGGYQYNQIPPGQDYCLWATLENLNDPDIVGSQARCQATCGGVGEIDAGTDYVVCND